MTEKLQALLEKKCSPSENVYNQYAINSINLKLNKENVEYFNELYSELKNSDLYTIARTSKGCIKKTSLNCYAWDCDRTRSVVRLTAIIGEDAYCINMGAVHEKSDEEEISGSRSFQAFKRMCEKSGINLENYAVKNGREIKEQIEKPFIRMETYNCVLENVHHLDFNSAWPAALVENHPEFSEVINWLYSQRKKNKKAKAILTHTIGYMQSIARCGAKYAVLSRDAINTTNKHLKDMAQELIEHGYEIVGYNTDGIWYQGDKPYHNENEGTALGQWKNDHVNCTFRAKSDGAYEYIEDGKYGVVYRGQTTLDAIKDRSEWEWGDIYHTTEIKYEFDEEKGFIMYED